jgi:hypothetical protein
MKQAYGNPARAKANPSCKKHEAPIVSDGEAIEDLEHLVTGLPDQSLLTRVQSKST